MLCVVSLCVCVRIASSPYSSVVEHSLRKRKVGGSIPLEGILFFYRHQLKPHSLPNVNPFHSGGHRMIFPLTRRRLLSAHNLHKIDLLTLTRALESTGARMLCTSTNETGS